MVRPVLQVALDVTELARAIVIAEESVAGGADWIEAGTPLIKSEGMQAVRALKEKFPGRTIIADMKVADTGTLEVEMAAKAGASIVGILADADNAVVDEAVRAARLYGVRLMADLINAPEPVKRAAELGQMGVDIIAAHTGIDQQMKGLSSIDLLRSIAGTVSVPLAVAGGIDADSAGQAVQSGASIVIVGGNIIRSRDVTASTKAIRDAIDRPKAIMARLVPVEDQIREILSRVSAPNVTDAMHRKGAMEGIFSICRDIKVAGKAVTVQTFAGDWAKPVEAIDIAQPGDVIVINNDGGTHVAPWGELATLSCVKRGIAGVVIDGAVRDVDDIRKMNFPIFAKAVCPNAGEPKGFGEINAEIRCCGQNVRPGDWIIGDESGVVVIPGERAYEVSRRALEVRKNEERIREEIQRGSTLSKVAELIRWEKK
jgi:3-hexulose-6-phosphate synthase/6-phospho-3-hexuloisomerase